MKNLDLLIPKSKPVNDRWTWATVTDDDPLAIRLDGETEPLAVVPECLIENVSIGLRVWVQISGRRVIVTGANGGDVDPPVEIPDGIPTGSMQMFAGTAAPDGWLLCNGATFSSTTYPELAALVGDKFGAHVGTSYKLPNMTNRFPLGGADNTDVGRTGGSNTIAESNLPTHSHSIDHDHPSTTTAVDGAHTHTANFTQGLGGANNSPGPIRVGSNSGLYSATISGSGGSGDHSHSVNIPTYSGESGDTGGNADYWQPFITLNFIIKT